MNNQDYLKQAVQDAVDDQEKRVVLLHYQQAIFETLRDFQPCDACATDLALVKQRAKKVLTKTLHYLDTVAVLPMQSVLALMNETQTFFAETAQLCPTCQATIQQRLLARFRVVHPTR